MNINSKELYRELLLNAIRWANNILVEVLSSYAARVNDIGRNHLKNAVNELAKAVEEFRK